MVPSIIKYCSQQRLASTSISLTVLWRVQDRCGRQLEPKTLQQGDDTIVTQSCTLKLCIYCKICAVADRCIWTPFLFSSIGEERKWRSFPS